MLSKKHEGNKLNGTNGNMTHTQMSDGTLSMLLRELESGETDTYINLASDFDTMLDIAERLPVTLALCNYCHKHPKAVRQVFIEAQNVINRAQCIDENYANPHDAVLVVYLWVLRWCGAYVKITASKIKQLPNIFWARRFADRILAEE